MSTPTSASATASVRAENGRAVHYPALDGLRGLALLGVLFFHANGLLPGGYLGVDLFFVLSGFLITSLLVNERARTGGIVLSTFWVRRARRLFPALLSLMPAIAAYGWYLAAPKDLASLRADAIATLAYVANWRAIFSHKSYWDLFAHPSPLEHTWSLSIEEQFYVVWPLLVALVLARGSRRILLGVTLALLAASVAATLWLYDPENVSRVYLGTDTRAAAILAGAAFACAVDVSSVPSRLLLRLMDAGGALAVLVLAWAWWRLEGEDPFLYHGGFWLTELACLVLIACATLGREGLVARVLSFRLLGLVGTVSYGAYLWHWPIDVVLTADRLHVHGAKLVFLQLAVTFAIASVSYPFFERPIRQHGLPFGKPVVMVPSAIALAVVLIVRATWARPEPPPPPPPVPVVQAQVPIVFKIMFVGDSTANSLGWGLRGVQKPGLGIELQGRDGCTMLADTCYGESWSDEVKVFQPNATILFLGGAFLHGITVKGKWSKACTTAWDDKFEKTVERRLGDLKAPGHEVWAATIPYPLGPYDSAPYRAETDCINASIRKAAAANEGVHVLDFGRELCPTTECVREGNGKTIRPDGVHYDIDGIHEAASWVIDQIAPDLDAGAVPQPAAITDAGPP